MLSLDELKRTGEAPEWMQEEGYKTLCNGYLLEYETPRQMYRRVAEAAAKALGKPQMANKFYDYIDKNWLCLATPVASNMGTDRGLPISCYSNHISDSVDGIFKSYHEIAMLTKNGGGVGTYWGDIRGRGAPLGDNGKSEGVIPWLKVQEQTLQAVSQSSVRRGAGAQYLPIEHPDVEEFIDIRRQTGDLSRRCLSVNFHHGICISDEFMNKVKSGNIQARRLWAKVLKARLETGEPYLFFSDTVNRESPQLYKDQQMKISTSNLCSEILLYTDPEHSFVCCLSSLNLARWDEWKDTDLVETATYFLDGVLQEFLDKAEFVPGLESAVNFAKKSRALGLGVLGWHTLLQSKMIPFDSFEAMSLNNKIFKAIDKRSLKATQDLAKDLGEPEWCKGYGVRNSHRLAIAPTVSNSLISGGVSQGIEPIAANIYSQKSAKGTFIRKNPQLVQLLESKSLNTTEVWRKINADYGSVVNIKELTDHEKDVFKTAREINQFSLVRQAAQRQKYIDQGQSLNLFFSIPKDINDPEEKKKLGKYINDVHIEAWELGVKTMYYLRSQSSLKGDSIYFEDSDCKSCEG